MTNKTQKVLDCVAMNPGATELFIVGYVLTLANQQIDPINSTYIKSLIDTLVDLCLLSRRKGACCGAFLNLGKPSLSKEYEADMFYVTSTTAYVYGTAFGKTKAQKMICPTCETENLINPFSKLESPKKCRHCKTELLPPRLQPKVDKEPGDGGFDMERSEDLKRNDIVVTSPLVRAGDLEEKVNDPESAFWDFKRRPIRITEDNRVFVVHDGAVRYNFGIGYIEEGPLAPIEDAEGHNPGVQRGGCRIEFSDVAQVDPTIPIRGFQGHRYRWW